MGLAHTVSSTRIIYSLLVEEVEAPGVIPLAILRQDNLELVEIVVPEHCPVAGNTVRKLNLPEDCVLFALVRGNDLLIPRGDTEIRPGDTVFAVVRRASESALRRLFCLSSESGQPREFNCRSVRS